MDFIIGQKINTHLDRLQDKPAPQSVEDLIDQLLPLMHFMTVERYVFDVILRHSGAAAKEDIGHIAKTFERQVIMLVDWLSITPFRTDVSPVLLAEGVQAFATQCMALHFCAINSEEPMPDRLRAYLQAWLTPV